MKKNNINTWIIIVSIIVAIIIGVGIHFIDKNKENNSKESPQSNEQAIREVIEKGYKLAYLTYGDVKVTEFYIINNGITYYALNDELLNDLKNLDDITNLIKDNFVENFVGQYLNDLSNENNNNYIEYNDNLYVHKSSNPCKLNYEYNSKDSLKINKEKEDTYNIAFINNYGIRVYKIDNTYKIAQNGFYCQE